MANWKKMAEAFGRAYMADNSTKAGRKLVRQTNMYKDLDGNVMPGQEFNPGNSPEGQAFQRGVGDAERIDRAAWDEGLDENVNPKETGDYKANLREQLSDARLRNERFGRAEKSYDRPFDKPKDEWDDAFKQSSDKFKSQSSALTNEDVDAWRSELLRTIDILRKRGFSDGDIINIIKGN